MTINKELLKEVESLAEKGEHFKKDVKLTSDGNQFDLKIPKKVSDVLGLIRGDQFRFHLITTETGEFELEI